MHKRFWWYAAFGLAIASPFTQARDGDLDAGFGDAGLSIVTFDTSAYANALAIAPDGRLVLAGSARASANISEDVAAARLLADGTPDPEFSGDGRVVITSTGATNERASAALVRADGRIVMAGATNAAGTYDMLVMQLDVDGSPDSGFGTAGAVVIPFDLGFDHVDQAWAVAEDAEGRLLVAGHADLSDGADASDVALARLNADGSLDTSFGGDGKTTFPFDPDLFAYPDSDYATSIAFDASGNILVGGYVRDGHSGDEDFAIARLLPSGAIDTSFGEEGRARIDFALGGWSDEAWRLLVAPDGAIYLVGDATYQNAYLHIAVARLTPAGTLDTAWGAGGTMTISMPSDDDDSAQASAAALQPDGKLIVAGTMRNGGGNFRFAFARLDANGQLDPTFGAGGTRAYGLGTAPDEWNEVVSELRIDADGHAVFSGYSYSQASFIAGRLVIDTIFDDGFEP